MNYIPAVFLLLLCNIGIGLFFALRELPELRSKIQTERAKHLVMLRAAWDAKKAQSESRAASARSKAQERSERLKGRETKRNAREQALNEYQQQKKIRNAKLEEQRASRDKRLTSKSRPVDGEE